MNTQFTVHAFTQLATLDSAKMRQILKRIAWLIRNISDVQHEQLAGDLSHLFKLRAGDCRILYQIKDETLFIHEIGHRREIYN